MVSKIPASILRDYNRNEDEVVRTREMAFLLSRLWTPCEPDQIPLLMGIKDVDADIVIEGISEAAKSLFFDLEEVREAIMFHEAEPFEYLDRSNKDTWLAMRICTIFNDTPGSGYVIRKHGPMAEAQLLITRGLLKVEEQQRGGVRVNVAEGAIMQLNGEHPFIQHK